MSINILVIRVGRTGDVVMITPALLAICETNPNANIHLLVGPDGLRTLKGFSPRIKRFIVYNRKGLFASSSRRAAKKEINETEYDIIFNFETKPSYQQFYRHSGAKTYSISEINKHKNYAENCLDVVREYSSDTRNHWLYLPVTEQGEIKARELLKSVGINENTYLIGMHPSFSGLKKSFLRSLTHRHQKLWPAEYYGQLACMLSIYLAENKINYKIIMDMLPDEREYGQTIVDAAEGHITLLTPEPDFERYKAILARMNLLIVPNTGPMHLAAAVGTRMIALFSELHPDDCGPYVPPEQFIVLRAEDTDTPELGLSAITPDSVFSAAKHFLPGG